MFTLVWYRAEVGSIRNRLNRRISIPVRPLQNLCLQWSDRDAKSVGPKVLDCMLGLLV